MKIDKPLISIITVSYNAVGTIESTIKSVMRQTYSNIEYIIVDGQSTDGTIDVIKKYSKKNISWISEPDGGIYDAMNKGLQIAKGDWCIFMGADDVFFEEDTIKKVVEYMKDPNKIYYGNVLLKNRDQLYPGRISSAYQLCRTNYSHQGLFYPIGIYKNKKYDLKYKAYADYVYNMQLYSSNSTLFEYMDMVISIFDDSGVSSYGDIQFSKDRWKLIRELFGYKLMSFIWMGYTLKHLFKKHS